VIISIKYEMKQQSSVKKNRQDSTYDVGNAIAKFVLKRECLHHRIPFAGVETDDYSVARGKLCRAEETSTLETDEEASCPQKRKRKPAMSDDELPELNNLVATPKQKVRTSVPLPPVPSALQHSVILLSVRDEPSGK
jgi:hypothetical protein